MKPTTKVSKIQVLIIICSLLFFSFQTTSALSTSFSDDFNRPDGMISNGWTSWWANNINHPKSMLINGELRSYGYNTLGGGIYRSFPVSFPVQFSFDFRTENKIIDPDCGNATYNDGGWRITINAAPYTTPMESVAQVKFEQWAGSRITVRRYITNSNAVNQAGMAEDVVLPVYGQRNFTENSSHVEGVIFEDLFRLT